MCVCVKHTGLEMRVGGVKVEGAKDEKKADDGATIVENFDRNCRSYK